MIVYKSIIGQFRNHAIHVTDIQVKADLIGCQLWFYSVKSFSNIYLLSCNKTDLKNIFYLVMHDLSKIERLNFTHNLLIDLALTQECKKF